MKKFFLSMVVALMGATATFAQNSQVATLSHGDNISTYYGSAALSAAIQAAVDGDIITLSSGSFQGATIEKKLTIRGAGMEADTINHILRTYIQSGLYLDGDSINLEGLYISGSTYLGRLKNAVFMKTNFSSISCWTYASTPRDIQFVNCKVRTNDSFYGSRSESYYGPQNWSFINSYVDMSLIKNYSARFGTSGYLDDQFNFLNCVVDVYDASSQYNCNFRNCIIRSTTHYDSGIAFNSSSAVLSSLVNKEGLLANQATKNECYVDGGTIFKTGTTFKLTDEAKAKYLGDDGTEVGMYGGIATYNPFPSNPKITKFNVASRTTADGKLSVDIEVKAAE